MMGLSVLLDTVSTDAALCHFFTMPSSLHVSREVERSANGRNTTASQEYWLAVRDRGHLL